MTPPYIEARNPGKPGAAKLRRALGADVVLSFLEKGFLALLDARELPRPRTNVDRRGDKVDCHWADRDLTIELVSCRFHGTRYGYETASPVADPRATSPSPTATCSSVAMPRPRRSPGSWPTDAERLLVRGAPPARAAKISATAGSM